MKTTQIDAPEIIGPDLALLVGIEREFNRIQAIVDQFRTDSIRQAAKRAKIELSADPSKITVQALSDLPTRFRKDFEDARAARLVAKGALATLTKQRCVPAILPAARRAISAFKLAVSALDQQERASAEAFGYPFVPSATLGAANRDVERMELRAKEFTDEGVAGYASPSQLLDVFLCGQPVRDELAKPAADSPQSATADEPKKGGRK